MASQASFTNDHAFEPPEYNNADHVFQNADIAETSISKPDHRVQSVSNENSAFVNDCADKMLDSGEEYVDLSCSLAQENLLDLDSVGLYGNGDSTSIDDWCEVLGTDFDLPMLEAGDQSFDPFLNSCSLESSTSWERYLTAPTSSDAVLAKLGNSYEPTPDLTECSTPTSLSSPNASRDHMVESVHSFDTENQRWLATLSRSRAADRYFLYGVLTTKIFCRPSCASRRPSRRRVRFFSFPGAIEAAEQARFRPCKRCKPETLGTGNTGVLAVSQILCKIIAETFEKRSEAKNEGLKLESLAKSARLSTFHFHRLFKATTQITPADFIIACHALALQDALCAYSVLEMGLDRSMVQLSPRWSERTARKALGGLTPDEYANGAKSKVIEYCHISTSVGDLEVAYSRDKKFPNVTVHATVLLQDPNLSIRNHFRASKGSEAQTQRFQDCIRELEGKCQDRDVELAADVLPVLWRARLWLKLTHELD